MKCIIFVILLIIEHPAVSAITQTTISVIKSTLKDYPVYSTIFILAFIVCVIFAFLKEFRVALGSGIVA
jgi:hypothetical protein